VKGVGAFVLAYGDPRRSTENQKMASHTQENNLHELIYTFT